MRAARVRGESWELDCNGAGKLIKRREAEDAKEGGNRPLGPGQKRASEEDGHAEGEAAAKGTCKSTAVTRRSGKAFSKADGEMRGAGARRAEVQGKDVRDEVWTNR